MGPNESTSKKIIVNSTRFRSLTSHRQKNNTEYVSDKTIQNNDNVGQSQSLDRFFEEIQIMFIRIKKICKSLLNSQQKQTTELVNDTEYINEQIQKHQKYLRTILIQIKNKEYFYPPKQQTKQFKDIKIIKQEHDSNKLYNLHAMLQKSLQLQHYKQCLSIIPSYHQIQYKSMIKNTSNFIIIAQTKPNTTYTCHVQYKPNITKWNVVITKMNADQVVRTIHTTIHNIQCDEEFMIRDQFVLSKNGKMLKIDIQDSQQPNRFQKGTFIVFKLSLLATDQ